MKSYECSNCARPVPDEAHGSVCRKCKKLYCHACQDVPSGRCWTCDGVAGAALHQRELREREVNAATET